MSKFFATVWASLKFHSVKLWREDWRGLLVGGAIGLAIGWLL